MNRQIQNKIFERNAHIRQKIWGTLFSLACIAVWGVLMHMDCINVWLGIMFVPIIGMGMWMIVTEQNYAWELKGEIEWSRMNRSRRQTASALQR